jgi:hypothetical protein
MLLLEVEPLDLGSDVRAVGLDLFEGEEHEPARGREAAVAWSCVIPAVAANESWGLDCFSHLDRVREFCRTRNLPNREASKRLIVVPALSEESLAQLLERFEGETFGVRAGSPVEKGDPALEQDLARRGADAYHAAFPSYFFCGILTPEDGSLVILSNQLWASEIVRRIRPALSKIRAHVRIGRG